MSPKEYPQETPPGARGVFEQARPRLSRLAGRFVDDAPAAVDDAATIFGRMIPDMAYVDKPDHPMAWALFVCSVNLAMYLALKERGVDVHDFGHALLTGLARAPTPTPAKAAPADSQGDQALQQRLAAFIAAAERSQRDAAPGEDVFEAVTGEGADFDWGYNVTSCAVCSAYSKYNAMDLAPYACAADDVMSDRAHQGLRRTGSIALGAQKCDFRYKRGGEPQRLAEQYPEQIRTAAKS